MKNTMPAPNHKSVALKRPLEKIQNLLEQGKLILIYTFVTFLIVPIAFFTLYNITVYTLLGDTINNAGIYAFIFHEKIIITIFLSILFWRIEMKRTKNVSHISSLAKLEVILFTINTFGLLLSIAEYHLLLSFIPSYRFESGFVFTNMVDVFDKFDVFENYINRSLALFPLYFCDTALLAFFYFCCRMFIPARNKIMSLFKKNNN